MQARFVRPGGHRLVHAVEHQHVKVDVEVKRAAEALDQRHRAALRASALDARLIGQPAGDQPMHDAQLVATWAEADAFARQAGFPEHQLVLRPEGENDARIRKEIKAWAELEAAFAWALAQAGNGRVFLENDLRAHAHSSRQDNIRLATEDLLGKLQSPCPACDLPGYWIVERIPGLPCADCGAPTQETRADLYGCLKCGHRDTRERSDQQFADPGRCDYCNP